jgi:hypothetical protein
MRGVILIVALYRTQGRSVRRCGRANTANVTTLLPVVDRPCHRFAIGRVCVVADRGMISAATIAALEQEYRLQEVAVEQYANHFVLHTGDRGGGERSPRRSPRRCRRTFAMQLLYLQPDHPALAAVVLCLAM